LLTVGLGVVLGLSIWLGGEGLSPSQGLVEALRSTPVRFIGIAVVILVAMAVGRWWVVAAVAGPFVALVVLQLTGHTAHELDGWAPPLNAVSIFGLVYLGLLLLILVAVRKLLELCLRKGLDVWRGHRATAGP
jgi:MFS family permease